jgi:nucleotide-binding universal stress UspA family protein
MGKAKRILVALAFSTYAKGTFAFGADLARRMEAELMVASIINQRDVESVRTISAMGYDVDGEHYVETIRKDRERVLAGIAGAAGVSMEKIRALFRVGNPVDELLRIIVEEDVDIVVMGPKGRTDLETVFVGSVAEKVFRRSPATVISYRDPEVYQRFKARIDHG